MRQSHLDPDPTRNNNPDNKIRLGVILVLALFIAGLVFFKTQQKEAGTGSKNPASGAQTKSPTRTITVTTNNNEGYTLPNGQRVK